MDNAMYLGRLNVDAARLQLKQNPELWNQLTVRTERPDSPHFGASDVWVRARDMIDFRGDWCEYIDEGYDPVWFRAASALPAVKDLCFDLMARVRGEKLGVVLITKVPAGGCIKPHVDAGYNAEEFEKYCICLEADPRQAFSFEEGDLRTETGDVFWFRNTVKHWVTNDSPHDRISLIISIKSDRG